MLDPPLARPQVSLTTSPNGTKRNDPYAWLRDDTLQDRAVLTHLRRENAYAQETLGQLRQTEDALLAAMDARVPRLEVSPARPSPDLSYWYGSSRGPGQDYWVHTRTRARPRRHGSEQGDSPTGPLSYGPDPAAVQEIVLDVNVLCRGESYCDVASVKPSPDGRFVAFTADTVGDERYRLVVREVVGKVVGGQEREEQEWDQRQQQGGEVPLAGGRSSARGLAPQVEWAADSRSLFALRLTAATNEPYQVLRCGLQLPPSGAAGMAVEPAEGAAAGGAGAEDPGQPLVLLEDTEEGARLQLGRSTSGAFLMVTRSSGGHTSVLALPLDWEGGTAGAAGRAPPLRLPRGLRATPRVPWLLVTGESTAADVLRTDHLLSFRAAAPPARGHRGRGQRVHKDRDQGQRQGRGQEQEQKEVEPGVQVEVFAAVLDTDRYPDGHVAAVMGGDLRSRVVLVEGRPGLQVVNLAVVSSAPGADGRAGGDGGELSGNSSSSSNTGMDGGTSGGGPFLVVHTLERMQAAVHVYDASGLGRWLQERQQQQQGSTQEHSGRKRTGKRRAHRGLIQDQPDSTGGGGSSGPESDSEGGSASGEEDAGQAASSRFLLPLLWSYSPGPSVSSLHLDAGCWPGCRLPYVRLSYSSLTTPVTTVDLDVAARTAYVRQVEAVEGFDPSAYRTATLWVPVPAPGSGPSPAASETTVHVPVTLAGRVDTWPPDTGRPLPLVLQVYGAYGNKLLPSFIPGDIAWLDAEWGGSSGIGSTSGAAGGRGCLYGIAHVRGGGELGSAWRRGGRRLDKWHSAEDLVAAAEHLVAAGYTRRDMLAAWGRSAGGLAVGMALHAAPGLLRCALLDVPFLDVLGAMADPTLPLTARERPEWGDPTASQADWDNIVSYSPYDNADKIVEGGRPPPALLATCSLRDPRVPYWGPAKFVARLRWAAATAAERRAANGYGGREREAGREDVAGERGTEVAAGVVGDESSLAEELHVGAAGGGDALDLAQAQAGGGRGAGGRGGPVLLLTEMGAGGHFGSGAAGARLRDRAMRFAFLLHVLGGSDSGGGGSGSGGGVDSGSGGGSGTGNALHA